MPRSTVRSAALACIFAAIVVAPASASPPVSEQFLCNGIPTTITHPPGATAVIGEQRFVVASFSFTPSGGTTQTLHTYGHKSGLTDAVTCTQNLPEGVFSVDLLPVPPTAG